ncbi:MAG: HAD family hydrolase [Sphaerochaetaceae bacterium]
MRNISITTILLDLDGTLLPMDQETFLEHYTKHFLKRCELSGISVTKASEALHRGVSAMLTNDGSKTNEELFMEVFTHVSQVDSSTLLPIFEQFYEQDFPLVQEATQSTRYARMLVDSLKEKGYTVVLATTPVFPQVATHQRVRWADLCVDDFVHITTYEEYGYSKPHLGYYRQILDVVGTNPQQALMIGNNVEEDMVVTQLGMDHYLVTDNLINEHDVDISQFNHGTLEEAYHYFEQLPPLKERM